MDDLRVGFDSRLKLSFCGSKVTSDAGLLAYRELDEALGLTEIGADVLTDSRLGTNKQPHGADGSFRRVDRQGPPVQAAAATDPRPGQFSQ